MRPQLTLRGCLELFVGVTIIGVLCFVLGIVLQVGIGAGVALLAPAPPPPLPTAAPVDTPPPGPAVEPTATPVPEATPEPTATPEPSATAAPTLTPEPSPTPPPPVTRYTVQPGDTLVAIAERYGVTVEAIVQANPGINPDLLSIGQEIIIPTP